MASLVPTAKFQAFDGSGNPLSGGKLYTYAVGTTTPQSTFTDSGGGTPNANPVILNARGEADVWFSPTLLYKLVLKDSTDVTIWTVDNVGGTPNISDLSNTSNVALGDALVGFKYEAAGSVAFNLHKYIEADGWNLFGFIDSTKHAGIRARTNTDDLETSIQDAINNVPAGVDLKVPGGLYHTAGNEIARAIVLRGLGYGRWFGTGPEFRAAGNQAHIIKYNNLTTDVNGLIVGGGLSDISLNANSRTISDAILVIEGFSALQINRAGFLNGVGRALRAKVAWEISFRDCMINGVNGSGSEVIKIDSRHNANDLLNVNNMRFNGCHLEGNSGPWFASQSDSNLDILEISHSKFEVGIPSGAGPYSLFQLTQGNRVDIAHNSFTNFSSTNKYDTFFECAAGSASISSNDFAQVDAAFNWLDVSGTAAVEFRGNRNFNSSGANGTLVNTSTRTIIYEPPFQADSSAAVASTAVYSNYSNIGISIHRIAQNGNKFIADSGSQNIESTVYRESAASAVIGRVPTRVLTGSPNAVRIGVRARSATGAGTVNLNVNGSLQGAKTLAITYATAWWELTVAQLASLGSGVTIETGSANAENVFVDEFYVLPLWHSLTGFATYDPPSLADGAGATTTVTVTGAELGNFAFASFSLDLQGITVTAWVSAADTVSVRFQNESGGLLDLVSGSLRVRVVDHIG